MVNMNLLFSKICVLSLLIVCRLISGLSPLFVSRKFRRKNGLERTSVPWVERSVAYGMDFSGGILLATCFIHMIPEVRHHLHETLGDDYRFPYTELLVCIGFFIVYVIEELVKHVVKKSHAVKKSGPFISVKTDDSRSIVEVCTKNHEEHDKETTPVSADANAENGGNGVSTATVNKGLILEMNSMMTEELNERNNNMKNYTSSNLKNFLLISALSFHSVMEGLAIGLAQNLEDVWYLFLAVSVHECTILLCIGIELVATCPSLSTVIMYMAVLALVSPAGVLFGTLITLNMTHAGESSLQPLITGSLQGLAAGTILYVTFFEVLNNNKHHHHHHGKTHQSKSGLPKLMFAALGFIFMVIFELLVGHGNDSSSSHSWSNKSQKFHSH